MAGSFTRTVLIETRVGHTGVGMLVGAVGRWVGWVVGSGVGAAVGCSVGEAVGAVGEDVGDCQNTEQRVGASTLRHLCQASPQQRRSCFKAIACTVSGGCPPTSVGEAVGEGVGFGVGACRWYMKQGVSHCEVRCQS